MKSVLPEQPFAEIIESSLTSWRSQCWQWDTVPTHGSIVTVASGTRRLFGLVHELNMGPADTQRTVFAYKKSEADLKKDHPHIFEFLISTFTCIPLGYTDGVEIRYQIAPVPPPIHGFVTVPSTEDLQRFFSRHDYLHALFMHADQLFSLDDLLLALMEQLIRTQILTHERLTGFIETFSLLTAHDYRRLKIFLQRVQPILQRQDPALCSVL